MKEKETRRKTRLITEKRIGKKANKSFTKASGKTNCGRQKKVVNFFFSVLKLKCFVHPSASEKIKHTDRGSE